MKNSLIHLLPQNSLSDERFVFSPYQEFAGICDLVSEVGTEQTLFYHVISDDGQQEYGIGFITPENVLERETAFLYISDGDRHQSRSGVPTLFFEGSLLTVQSYVPSEFKYLLALEDSVVCSNEPFCPTVVQLQEKTLLGKLDGRIQSIDSNELREIMELDIAAELRTNKKPLILGTRQLELVGNDSQIAASSLWLRPSERPTTAKRGMVIFNKDTGHYEGYNGEWVQLDLEKL